jgi:hypothetical protein
MKRTTVIAAVVAFGLGGLVGALAFFGLPLPDRGGTARFLNSKTILGWA